MLGNNLDTSEILVGVSRRVFESVILGKRPDLDNLEKS